MQVLKFPNPILFEKCDGVTVFGEELKVLLESMYEVMGKANGIGLAANQVGLKYRMFVMEGPNKEKLFLVNPLILRKSENPANIREGCLSAPGEMLVLSERSSWVEVKFKDETGTEKVRVFKDVWAVCCQHEIGHLNGESFLESKSIKKSTRKLLAKKWGIND